MRNHKDAMEAFTKLETYHLKKSIIIVLLGFLQIPAITLMVAHNLPPILSPLNYMYLTPSSIFVITLASFLAPLIIAKIGAKYLMGGYAPLSKKNRDKTEDDSDRRGSVFILIMQKIIPFIYIPMSLIYIIQYIYTYYTARTGKSHWHKYGTTTILPNDYGSLPNLNYLREDIKVTPWVKRLIKWRHQLFIINAICIPSLAVLVYILPAIIIGVSKYRRFQLLTPIVILIAIEFILHKIIEKLEQ